MEKNQFRDYMKQKVNNTDVSQIEPVWYDIPVKVNNEKADIRITLRNNGRVVMAISKEMQSEMQNPTKVNIAFSEDRKVIYLKHQVDGLRVSRQMMINGVYQKFGSEIIGAYNGTVTDGIFKGIKVEV